MKQRHSAGGPFRATPVFVAACLLSIWSSSALADGTETLGAPSIAIAEGSGVVAAGAGLRESAVGLIEIDVPGNVVQVLLYWDEEACTNTPSADTIEVNGSLVEGALIGGPAFFFDDGGQSIYKSSYRADITQLGLVDLGMNSLTVIAPNNPDCNNDGFSEYSGAGILVIYDDGTPLTEIIIRDGADLAFANFPPPRQSTVPQTFTFAPANFDRTSDLIIFAGNVDTGDTSTIRLTTAEPGGSNPQTSEENDLLMGVDGALWDTLTVPVIIPAEASSLEVQILSGNTQETGNSPASLNWVGAALSLDERPNQGCSPGYWRQSRHFDSWTGQYPANEFEVVFGVDASFDATLLDALSQNGDGSGEKALGRHAVAALLNAANLDVSYIFSSAEVIGFVQNAYAVGDFETVKDLLEAENETMCPLD